MALGTPDQLWNCLGPLKIETRTISRAVSADRGEITPGTYVPRASIEFFLMAVCLLTYRFWVPGRHRASGKTDWRDRSKARPRIGGPIWPGGVRLSIIPPFQGKLRDRQLNCALSRSPLVELKMDFN